MHDPKTALRLRIARHLGGNGPVRGDAMQVALGLTAERFWEAINHPWFDITGRGWKLTTRGEREALHPATERAEQVR